MRDREPMVSMAPAGDRPLRAMAATAGAAHF